MSDDDWRVRMTVSGEGVLDGFLDRLRGEDVAHEARRAVPDGVVVSRDGDELFLYGATREGAETAAGAVRAIAARHDHELGEPELERWHPDEERWEPPAVPLPGTPAEHAREHARLQADERAESDAQLVPEWEVDLHLPSRGEAVAFAERLEAEGIPHRRSWAYVRVAAATEDDARALGDRLRGEAPAGTTVSGPLGSQAEAWDELHPFAAFGGMAN